VGNWISQTKLLKDRLQEEIATSEQEREARKQAFTPTPVDTTIDTTQWQPQTQWTMPVTQEPITQTPTMPVQTFSRRQVTQTPTTTTKTTTPVTPTTQETTETATKTTNTPFWKRALDVFNAPFDWIDKYVIKPTLGIIADPLVPDAKRNEGEDYFSWKRRSWEEWEAPKLFKMKMPWGDWTVDVKGIAELAPWLLIPAAGEVGGLIGGVGKAAKAGSTLSKISKIAKPIGKAIQLSPWGLVEKGTGAAMKVAGKAVGGTIGKAGTAVSEKLYGKIPAATPYTAAENKLKTYLTDSVLPTFKKTQKAIKEMESSKGAVMAKAKADYQAGKITQQQWEQITNKALPESAKPYYQMTPEKLAQRKANDIAEVEARIRGVNENIRDGIVTPASGNASINALKGEITKINNSPEYVAQTWTQAEAEEFRHKILSSAEKGFTSKETVNQLDDLLTNCTVPEPRFFGEIANVYGGEMAETLRAFSQQPLSMRQKILDWMNIPRSVLASGDLSGTARQGLILSITHPTLVPKAFARQLKAFASEKLSLDMDDILRSKSITKDFLSKDGYLADVRKAATKLREESFPSQAAEKLPFVRQSERAFATYLNELRVGTYEAGVNTMIAQGATDKEIGVLIKFINNASGRGDLPAFLEKHADVLNTFLFSTRLQASKFNTPKLIGQMLLSDNPYMKKEAAKALVAFVGGGIGIISLLEATGVADIEKDPRSADFGKIKFKNSETRLDIWTGYIQYIRFIGQMLTGESKTAFGNINKQGRDQIAWRFLQSKSAPAFGLVVDLLRGESYQGEPLFKDTAGTLTAVGQRVIPLALQDIMDAAEQSGINGVAQAAPSFFGVGALTYVNKFAQYKNLLAKQNGKDNWDDLDPLSQRRLEQLPEFQVKALEFDRQAMGTAWGDWGMAGRAIEDNFSGSVNQAVNKYRQNTDEDRGVAFREDIADAYTARRGAYEARKKDERFSDIVSRLGAETPQEALVKMGMEQYAIQVYNEAMYDDNLIDEFGDYDFAEADARRAMLKQSLNNMQAGLFDYIEEYMGVKYESYPAEFQELRKAKEVLKLYWQVEEEVIKTYGTPETKYQQARVDKVISRIRKRMKATNKDIAYYLDMFYS